MLYGWLLQPLACAKMFRLICVLVLLCRASCFADEVTPLIRAHAHNDYVHQRPLLDALSHGFCSVEADIFLVNGELVVGHNIDDTKPERTLESLYLKPLQVRVRQNNGRVFTNGPSITLLVDFKLDEKRTGKDPVKSAEESERTYAVFNALLRKYESILTRFSDSGIKTNAITVLVTGARPASIYQEKGERLAAIDGHLSDLDSKLPFTLVPLVSDKWSLVFQWNGRQTFGAAEKAQLEQLVKKAHGQGRRLRFWGIPDREEVWQVLLESGVDLINSDNLSGLEEFLRKHDR